MRRKHWKPDSFRGVWSATPTPLTHTMQLDKGSVRRLVDHHLRLGIKGLFLCGTCGEGPWLTNLQRIEMVHETVRCVNRRIPVAAQVTDNSAARIVTNMQAMAAAGADIAVIAPPHFLFNGTPENVIRLYQEAIRKSPLPVGIYDRGAFGSVVVQDEAMDAIYAEPKVVLVKDSSANPARRAIALKARRRRPELRLLDGDEFHCVDYLAAGYDGLLLGGGIFNGRLAGMIVEAVKSGDIAKAERLQKRMNRLMWDVYGGKKIKAWLSGLKELLVRMRIFRTRCNYPRYPLPDFTSRAITRAMRRERAVLLP